MMAEIFNKPQAQGQYKTASRFNNFIFTAGMTPRRNGELIFSGQVKLNDELAVHKEAVELAVHNALTAARSVLQEEEKIILVLLMTVYINAEDGFIKHTKLADFASAFLAKELGEQNVGSRVAIGVSSLPGNALVEIQLTVVSG